MQHWWCSNVDASNCAAPVDPLALARAVSLQTKALRFLRTAISWAASSAKFVPQAEAERRAAICVGCPMNQDISCGGGCGFTKLLNAALKLFNKETSRSAELRSCGICGCLNSASVWIPLEVMDYPELAGDWEKANPLCWHK
jgi:hypothetical protein